MALLQESDRQQIRQRLEAMKDPVQLINFKQELECMYCRETRQLLEELAELSDKLTLQKYNFQIDSEEARTYGIDKIPATIVKSPDKDYGIRYYGIPSGYEFASLLEDILMVSSGESGLSEQSKAQIRGIQRPVHIQVFVTPTCPYCPMAVRLAHQIAMESEYVKADMIESTEFPHLAQKYEVMGVPKTVINETVTFEGAVPEEMFVQRVMDAVKMVVSS